MSSVDSTTSASTFYLYKHGKVTPLKLGPNEVAFLGVNNQGLIAGTSFVPGPNNDRAFRFDPRSGVMTLLILFPVSRSQWGQASTAGVMFWVILSK